MVDELRDRILHHLSRNRVCVISTSGSLGAWAVAAQYGHEGLGLDCQVPRWSDVVYYLEQDPRATAIVVDTAADHLRWLQYRGRAHITHSADDRYVAIHIAPERIDLIDESRGWGARETLELCAEHVRRTHPMNQPIPATNPIARRAPLRQLDHAGGTAASLDLPPEVPAVFREFRTCEFSTFAKNGTPITWPTAPFWLETGQFLITSSIGISQKIHHVRRNPRVSLLFSDPTGSQLADPPTVLVQGDATAPDEIVTTTIGYEEQFRTIFRRQPASALYSRNALTRYLFDWYYMRLLIYVTPCHITWWAHGDFTRIPHELEVTHVG